MATSSRRVGLGRGASQRVQRAARWWERWPTWRGGGLQDRTPRLRQRCSSRARAHRAHIPSPTRPHRISPTRLPSPHQPHQAVEVEVHLWSRRVGRGRGRRAGRHTASAKSAPHAPWRRSALRPAQPCGIMHLPPRTPPPHLHEHLLLALVPHLAPRGVRARLRRQSAGAQRGTPAPAQQQQRQRRQQRRQRRQQRRQRRQQRQQQARPAQAQQALAWMMWLRSM